MRAPLVALAMLLPGCLGAAPGASEEPPAAFARLVCGSNLTAHPCLRLAGSGPANEVSVALSPDGRTAVGGAKDYRLGAEPRCIKTSTWAGVYRSEDGGATWTDGLLDGYPTQEPPSGSPLRGYTCITDPVLQFGADGAAYYSGLAYGRTFDADADETVNAKGWNLFVARSDDGGKTWPTVAIVAEGDGGAVVHDKQWFVVDPSDPRALYVVWALYVSASGPRTTGGPLPLPPTGVTSVGNVIAFSRSLDGGRTWSPPKPLVDVPGAQLENQFAMPAVGPDGTVYVTWVDFRTNDVVLVRSADRGDSWTTPRPIQRLTPLPPQLPGTQFRTSTLPILAADTSDGSNSGRLYLAWADYATGDSDVLVVSSDDGGDTWTEPLRIHEESTADQFMPWLVVGPEGTVHAAWSDRRDDPGNRLVGASYARSLDGASWGPSLRLAAPSDGDLSFHQRGEPFFGDYNGLSASADRAVFLFAATYDGTARPYAAVVER